MFNVGQLRRSRAKQKAQEYLHLLIVGVQSIDIPRSGICEDHTASYFSHENVEATKLRDKLASDSLEMLIQWLKDGGNVGILGATPGDASWCCAHNVFLDATNSTRNRRQVSDTIKALTSDRFFHE